MYPVMKGVQCVGVCGSSLLLSYFKIFLACARQTIYTPSHNCLLATFYIPEYFMLSKKHPVQMSFVGHV